MKRLYHTRSSAKLLLAADVVRNAADSIKLMEKDAVLDKSRKYRYVLKRQWGANANNFVNFILLNPSTADERTDDRTVTACVKFAESWGFDGLFITNLFAFRATNPNNLLKTSDPLGEENDDFIIKYAKASKIIVIAWGNHGKLLNRDDAVFKLIVKIKAPHCLGRTKTGSPKHPLYIKRTTKPVKYV